MDKKTLDIILAVMFFINIVGVASHFQTGDGGLVDWLLLGYVLS